MEYRRFDHGIRLHAMHQRLRLDRQELFPDAACLSALSLRKRITPGGGFFSYSSRAFREYSK